MKQATIEGPQLCKKLLINRLSYSRYSHNLAKIVRSAKELVLITALVIHRLVPELNLEEKSSFGVLVTLPLLQGLLI